MPMSVTEESGGRLNAFATEPKMQLVKKEASDSNASRIIIFVGTVVLISLIAFTLSSN